MNDRLRPIQTLAHAAGFRDRSPARRRGSVLVLVMAVLGILFVIGIAFLSSIEFEANMARLARQRNVSDASVRQVSRLSQDMLLKGVFPAVGKVGTASLANVSSGAVTLNRDVYAELPGLGLLSQLEPVHNPSMGEHFYTYTTDLELLLGPTANAFTSGNTGALVSMSAQNLVFGRPYMVLGPDALTNDTIEDSGIGLLAPVDTDGDGIRDARQIPLTTDNLPSEELRVLAEEVNDPALSDPEVFLGMRAIAHGGMVNLNDSHPALQRNVLSIHNVNINETFDAAEYINRSEIRHGPYSPLLEEAPLRHRFMLPPRHLPVSAVQGDPLATRIEPPGGGDYGSSMFVQGENLEEGYQYWMYGEETSDDSFETWSTRMDPAAGSKRDRRHLLTTISHEGQLVRGSMIETVDPTNNNQIVEDDILDLFTEVTEIVCPTDPVDLPFEFVDYPHPIVSGHSVSTQLPLSWCDCFNSPQCENDPRKGRLKLSIPWLDPLFDSQGMPLPTHAMNNEDQRNDLIYETFFLLLLNARSEGNGEFGSWSDGNGSLSQRIWEHDFPAISRAAAALTANMIDFMDIDDEPTAIDVRDFTFDSATINSCANDPTNCPLGGQSASAEVVYGLERQPYITEIAVVASSNPESTGSEEMNPADSAYAVEVFNPYDRAINNKNAEFALVVGTDLNKLIPLRTTSIGAGSYYVVANNRNAFNGLSSNALIQDTAEASSIDPLLEFVGRDVIHLVRVYSDGSNSSYIVVDRFEVPDDFTRPSDSITGDDETRSIQREGTAREANDFGTESPWFAPIPAASGEVPHTLLDDNLQLPTGDDTLPVQVLIANTGSFETAFPTTGSLLLLMRHGNYILGGGRDSFTAMLDGNGPTISSEIRYTIDNGRMPVFDSGLEEVLNGVPGPSQYRHFNSVNPAVDPTDLSGSTAWPENRPGELMHLPWGQLVWDYFTALPLSNPGPYRTVPDDTNMDVAEDAQPRVDMDGLRVHGRININAAPWKVLAGLPYIPLEDIPGPFRDIFDDAIGGFVDHKGNTMQVDEAGVLGEARARAIVDYRELRCGAPDPQNPNSCLSADFGGSKPFSSDYGRGWDDAADATNPENSDLIARRGTGFLTIGELANVRGLGVNQAIPREYRMDAGALNGTGDNPPTYLKAIAPLVCLGDWATVRSDVFTVYGTLRGAYPQMQVDNASPPELAEMRRQINDRAIRFQETLDRLPIFMGDSEPKPIGNRVVGPYGDVVNN